MSASDQGEDDPKHLAQCRARDWPRPGEVYRHYKGGIYSIVATSIKEDTLEPLVTYHSNLMGTNWTRTLDVFRQEVEVEDPARRLVRRFTRLMA